MIALARVNWLHSRCKTVSCLHLRLVKTYKLRCFVVKQQFCIYVVLVRFRASGERGLSGKGCVMAASDLPAFLAVAEGYGWRELIPMECEAFYVF